MESPLRDAVKTLLFYAIADSRSARLEKQHDGRRIRAMSRISRPQFLLCRR
jgi:myo-inositol catabolism protein IolC